jgi:hypothetical protein
MINTIFIFIILGLVFYLTWLGFKWIKEPASKIRGTVLLGVIGGLFLISTIVTIVRLVAV